MHSFLYLKVKGYSSHKVVQKLISINVSVYDLKEKNEYVYVKVKKEDYENIEKYLKTIKFTKVRYTGLDYFKQSFKRYQILVIAFCLSIFFILLCSNVIVDIDVIHEDEQLTELITEELESFGIKKFSFQKSYSYLQKVKKEIKNRHLDQIDWLEINKVGMKYVVRVEERIINNEITEESYCHLYADKDALIRKIKIYRGEGVVNINDYVKKGDLLISGDIHLNEEVVENVCASGSVYAEVWYEVSINVPFEHYENEKTGKKRNNLIINYNGIDYQIFKDRLENYEEKRKIIFDLLGVKIYLKTEEEIIKNKVIYKEEEALEKAQELAIKKVQDKLKDGDQIISQKILQNKVIDSTMEVDIFIVAEEEISSQVVARKEAENGL